MRGTSRSGGGRGEYECWAGLGWAGLGVQLGGQLGGQLDSRICRVMEVLFMLCLRLLGC